MLIALLGAALAADTVAEEPPTIDVTGVGEVWVAPDEAVLTLGVEAQGSTASKAFDAASSRMTAIADALGQTVPKERLRTSQLSLQPRYNQDRQLIGFQASALVEVRVDDPAETGALLDAAVAAGANDVAGVAFRVEDEDAVRQEALTEALAEARATAERVAEELGVTLGAPQSVVVQSGGGQPQPMLERAAAVDEGMATMPVMSGQQQFQVVAGVKFAIGEEPRM